LFDPGVWLTCAISNTSGKDLEIDAPTASTLQNRFQEPLNPKYHLFKLSLRLLCGCTTDSMHFSISPFTFSMAFRRLKAYIIFQPLASK
jgi:hypothetical protein